jgi:hypothetical protein
MQKIKDKNINFRMNTIFSLQSAIGSQQFEDQYIFFSVPIYQEFD